MGNSIMNGKKILIIDDDTDLVQLTSLIFRRAGAKVITHRPNLVILDVMMPGADGYEVCQKIRQVSSIPLMMISALNHDQNLLQGFKSGADDYLSKPFNPEVLLSRAEALLRRSGD